jgi:thiamine-monophosphate kinase
MREEDIIRVLSSRLRRSGRQLNAPFASDAEIVDSAGGRLALTIDDFSAEDCLPATDPRSLAWNLVVATVSDLLAVGARPEFMLNSLVTARFMNRGWLEAFSAGMQEALSACGVAMLGGDVGSGEQWHFTGVALGTFPAGREPLMRIVATPSGAVLATGSFGDANLAALGGDLPLRFECRAEESAMLPPGAACLDTSDGLARSLEILVEQNPGLRVEIDLGAVPYADDVETVAAAAGAPAETFLLGAAGEYEMVALVGENAARGLETSGGWRRIGKFARASPAGLFYRRPKSDELVAHEKLPDPRDSSDLPAYRDAVIALARRLFGHGGKA